MKLAVLSDIHSHFRALEHFKEKLLMDHCDLKFCILGDVIGYGHNPVGCLKTIKELDDQGMIYRDETNKPALIGGNHEEAWIWCEERFGERMEEICHLSPEKHLEPIISLVHREIFGAFMTSHKYIMNKTALIAILLNMVAMRDHPDPAIEWYRSIISANGYGPLTFPNTGPGKWNLVLAHGTREKPLDGELFPCDPDDPGKLERYVNSQKNGGGKRLILLHGHTHVPLYFGTGVIPQPDLIYNDGVIDQDAAVTVINPGSVGLPRDRDRRPSMALLELGEKGFKTTFLRDGPEDLNHKHIEHLKEANYPEKIIEFVRTAPTHKPLVEECEQVLQKRAGQNWTPLDDQ